MLPKNCHHPGETKQMEASRRVAVAERQAVRQALVGTCRASVVLGRAASPPGAENRVIKQVPREVRGGHEVS